MRSMHRTWSQSLLVVIALTLAGCATPEEAGPGEPAEPSMLTPNQLQWQEGPPSLPEGARFAVLTGDPGAEGPFTMRLEVPAQYDIPPHTHPGTESVTILSGTAYVGMGETLDRATATPLPAGSFFVMPPGNVHYFFTGDEPVVAQLHGQGPWDIHYHDPTDDPRGGQQPPQ